MSAPAIRALKESFNCHITLLASSMAAAIAPFIFGIDDILIYNFPWVKTDKLPDPQEFSMIVDQVKSRHFDACVLFTVYSQNPLSSMMIPYLAGIPLRLAYCRENPYGLINNWVPDREPYELIQHQVKRDLNLVAHIGAVTQKRSLEIKVSQNQWPNLKAKLTAEGGRLNSPWLIIHAGVSEQKRQYPAVKWIETAKKIITDLSCQVFITGGPSDRVLTENLVREIGDSAVSLAGKLSLEEFILLIKMSPLIISVNTAAIHMAAATKTPVIVLYALTNPQHTPWMAEGELLLYDIPREIRSKNQVIEYVTEHLQEPAGKQVQPTEIVEAAKRVLSGDRYPIPELTPLRLFPQQIF